ncbi:F-box DNA helicase 1-like isoform X3 [Amblyomma americanum]
MSKGGGKRSLRLDFVDCQVRSSSAEGAAPLVDPSHVRRSSVDPNRGLYPRGRSRRRNVTAAPPVFQAASSLLPRTNSASHPSAGKSSPQANKITSYFVCGSKRPRSPPAEDRCEPDSHRIRAAAAAEAWHSDSSSSSDSSVVITAEFGLLPAVRGEEEWFSLLPIELLERILSHVSLQDLLLSCSRVCTRWYAVIRSPHRKRYYRYKSGRCSDATAEVQALCIAHCMHSVETCLPGLIRYMASFGESTWGLQEMLERHPKCDIVMEVLQGAFGDSLWPVKVGAGAVRPWWSAVAALVVVASDSMWDVRALFLGGRADSLALSEALYCLATFLLHFQLTFGICHGLHYRAYYALHLTERPAAAVLKVCRHPGQQSLWKFGEPGQRLRFTYEQMRIINHELSPGDVVRIVAFAGTGKTSTLVEYARLRPAARFLCIVYNKSVCDIGKRTFSPNVECRTAHSLAFRAVGFRYKDKLASKVRVLDISRLVSVPTSVRMPRLRFAKLVLSSIEQFLASADPLLTTAHVPDRSLVEEGGQPVLLNAADRLAVSTAAAQLWERMADRTDTEARMTHDGYLKLFQLQQPSLGSYDAIFVDEAQDCNPAMLSLVLDQACAKVLVGDPHQQIYAFRRAVDALSSVPATHTFCLTQSFRFGPAIGYVASCTLEVLKGVTDKTIIGTEAPDTVLGSMSGQVAVLARSNLVLFNMAVDIVCNGQHADLGLDHVRGAFVGGIAGYGFQQILDVYHLKYKPDQASTLVRDAFVGRFSDYGQLKRYAQASEDLDLCAKLAFVDIHEHSVPHYVHTIQLRCSGDQRLANVVFSTVHKAKGLEFDTVFLADDFCMVSSEAPRTTPERQQEYHVLYVAVTRARQSLFLSRALYFLLLQAQESFEQLQLWMEAGPRSCLVCQRNWEPRGRLVWCRTPVLVGCHAVEGGIVCKTCALQTSWEPPVQHQDWQELQNVHRQSMSTILEPLL